MLSLPEEGEPRMRALRSGLDSIHYADDANLGDVVTALSKWEIKGVRVDPESHLLRFPHDIRESIEEMLESEKLN